MAEIMAVTNEAGYGSSIHPAWSLKFFLILTLILTTGVSGKKLSSIGLEMAEILAVTNKAG